MNPPAAQPEPDQPQLVYQRIAEDLRQHIQDQGLPPGAALPSQSQLMRQYRASSLTVQKAVAVLREQGWAHARPGKGTFVARRAAHGPGPHPKEEALPRADPATIEALQRALEAALEQITALHERVEALEGPTPHAPSTRTG